MNILERRINTLEELNINRQRVIIVQLPSQTEEEAIQGWMKKNNTTEPPVEIDYMIHVSCR